MNPLFALKVKQIIQKNVKFSYFQKVYVILVNL